MTARVLEHYNIRSTRFRETVAFYTEVLGLRNGHYPVKEVPGAWMYDVNDVPVVHIINLNPSSTDTLRKLDEATMPRSQEPLSGSGAIDHIAFAGVNHTEFCQRLDRMGVEYKLGGMIVGLRQVFLKDPNGILIEMNFREEMEHS